MNKIKRFYFITRDPLGYLLNIVALISLFSSYKLNIVFPNWLFILILLVLILLVIYNLSKFFYEGTYAFSSYQINNNLDRIIPSANFEDYDRIIPSDKMLTFLLRKYVERATIWAPDAVLTEVNLWFTSKEWTKVKIKIDCSFTFFSKIKRMTVIFNAKNLKVSSQKTINNSQLQYSDNRSKITPFFMTPYWKEALIIAFQRMESELIGKTFSILVQNVYGHSMWIQFMPDSVIARSYVFTLDGNKLNEENQTIKDFSEEKKA